MLDYLEWKRSTVAVSSFSNYQLWSERFVSFLANRGKGIEALNLGDIAAFKSYLQEEGYSPKNVQYGLSIVRDFIGYQVSVHRLDFPLKLFRIKNERSQSHHSITESEYRYMLNSIQPNTKHGLQRRLLLQLLWDTGMRANELLNLKISQLHKPCEAIIETEKNQKNRLIRWEEDTEKLLQIYLGFRKQLCIHEDWLFISFFDRKRSTVRMNVRSLQFIVKEASRGLESKISPHSFRHGFTHRKLDLGLPITTVSQMLGHSTSLNVMTYSQRSGIEMQQAWGVR